MGKLTGKTVFITGASAGIGAALAREYARRGANLVLTARRRERLEEVASQCAGSGGKVLTYAADVTRDGDLPQVVAQALREVSSIDIVIANAGFGVVGAAENLDLDDYRRQFETNVFGVLRTFYATLPALKQSRGCFAIIGSANGYLTLPDNSAYAMSKHAVRALADALRHELRPYGVGVTHISPGLIATEFRQVDNAGQLSDSHRDPVPNWVCASPEHAARVIVRAVRRRVRERPITFHSWLLIRLVRHFPGLTHALMGVLGVKAYRQPS